MHQRQRTDGSILSFMVDSEPLDSHLSGSDTAQALDPVVGPGTLFCDGHGTAITSSDDSSLFTINDDGRPAARKRSRHSAFGTSSDYSDDVYDGYSPFYGVYKYNGKWYAQEVTAGPFATCIEAAIHYDVAAVSRFGRAAMLNFPELRRSDMAHRSRPRLKRLADHPPEPRRPCKLLAVRRRDGCVSPERPTTALGQHSRYRKRSRHADTLRSHSGSYAHSAFTATTESAYHARSDANALDTAGRQDGQQKGSNDSAALAALAKPDVVLTHGRAHVQFIPWHNALKAFSCSFPMGTKVLSGTILLADVLAKQPSTHSIEFEINQKVPVYAGMNDDDRRDAEAYNAWLLLARHTSAASNKIYLWIYKGVDATIKHTIVAKTGDGYGAFMIIKQMFDKPSRMLQRKLVSVFFSGDFDTTKGLDMLITQIDDATERINSMGMSPRTPRSLLG